jgi:diguanylate cyclase (GGDEF)-like protein/PAS domain S-box-containing protein
MRLLCAGRPERISALNLPMRWPDGGQGSDERGKARGLWPLSGPHPRLKDGAVLAIDWFGLLRVARSDRRVAAAILAVAAALAASVFALRVVVTDPNAAVLVLLSVPVVLVAIVLGRWGGLAAAGGALVLVAVYHVAGHPMDWVGYVARGSAFVLLGLGLGAFSDYAVATQRRLSALLDGTLDAVTVGTPVRDATGSIVDGRVAYANSAAVSFFGRSPAEVLGRRWSELWPGSFTPELFAALVAVIQTGEPVELTDFEIPLDHPSGTLPVMLDLRATAFGDGLMVAWREVSARLRDARAVAAANARFAAAFDHAPVGMMLIDPDRVIVQANAAFGAISGRPTEELVGMALDALIDPRDLPDSRADFARLMAGETSVYHRERRLVTADGEARWVAVRVSSITGADDGAYAVEHVEDIHERKSLEDRLQYLADHDPLTGLFNRRRFYEELSHQLALDERYGRSSIVALIDLDNFKYINDTLGHAAGDQLIQGIARTLRARLRASDVLGRLGGDEFGVLLPTPEKVDLAAVIGSLLAAVAASEVDCNGQRVRSTASIGVATLGGEAGEDPDTALANADLAMYAAKEAGRNTFVVYDPHGPHAERSRARFRWLDRIRNALDHDLFTLVGQPILEMATGNITGCELLLRMREDDRLILPDRFLYIAERHGLATAIDRVVISHGIALAAARPRPAGFRWEINLSADALSDPGISDLIEAQLAHTGVPPGTLVFEITETAAIANMSQAQVFATRITDIGCRFALDDFGAGYGSFYYLKHLPFAYLKIDGEFIRQLTSNHTDRVIVRAIVTAAHDLGKQTIAEYVGDADTLDLLRQLHVDHAQGHHIGPASDPLAHAPTS